MVLPYDVYVSFGVYIYCRPVAVVDVLSNDEVIDCSVVTGQSADYLLRVVVKDMNHFEAVLLGKLTRIAGVTGVHSSFVLRKVINRTEIPLG